MDRIDSEIIEWIYKSLVVKGGAGSGEQPGHPFRGNQYTRGSGSRQQAAAGGGGGGPHEFSGNQYPKPNWGDKNLTPKSLKDVKVHEGETKTAAQIMEAVNRYADAHPDTMNGYSDKESHIKFIAEHEDAIPRWLSDKVTQKDVSVLEDNNYHTANTVIASRRPDIKGWTNEKALAQWDTQKSAEISKGDVVGHEFHGNQWTDSRGWNSHISTHTQKLVDKAKELSEGRHDIHTGYDRGHDHRDVSAKHQEIADKFAARAALARKYGDPFSASRYQEVASAHQAAADAHSIAAIRADEAGAGAETPDEGIATKVFTAAPWAHELSTAAAQAEANLNGSVGPAADSQNLIDQTGYYHPENDFYGRSPQDLADRDARIEASNREYAARNQK